jgi:hypothetical protein
MSQVKKGEEELTWGVKKNQTGIASVEDKVGILETELRKDLELLRERLRENMKELEDEARKKWVRR